MKRSPKPSYRFYRVIYCITRAALGIFLWLDVRGKENIPDGAAMVSSNH